MSSRAKKKKAYRAKHGIVRKPKKKLGSIHDCCGNCTFGLDIFDPFYVKCTNRISPYFKAQMPKNKHCIEYK